MIRSGWNTKTPKMTARTPTRKSSRGKGDFTATVGIFVATSANVVVVRNPKRKDQKKTE